MAMVLGEGLRAPAHHEVSPRFQLTSETLPWYVLPNGPIVRASDIATHLDIAPYTPQLKELATIRNTDFKYSEADREKLLRVGIDMESTDPAVQMQRETQRKQNIVLANQQVLVETGITFLYDPSTEYRPIASAPYVGTPEFVNHNMYEILAAGKYPTIPAHQHWEDLPQSYDDVLPHVVNPYEMDGGRLAKVTIVVGQQRQWLTVATAETLMLSDKDVPNYLEYWDKRFKEHGNNEEIRIENMQSMGILLFESTDMQHFKRVT